MEIKRRSDQSELFFYNTADFPVLAEKGVMSEYPNSTALAHWHDDLEFSVVLSGSMKYQVNQEVLQLQEGEGIFVNSRQLHGNYCTDPRDCQYLCLLFHPMLLCASPYTEQNFVQPILSNEAMPYWVLHRDVPWENRISSMIQEVFKSRTDRGWALKSQSLFFRIWNELYENAPVPEAAQHTGNRHLSELREMVSFIQSHYREKLTLEKIARAGHVSKMTCCRIFKNYVNQSPISYLIEFRLRCATELLKTTDLTVTEICYEVGFSGASYFSECFRGAFGCSPMEFRKNPGPWLKSTGEP